MDAKQKQLGEEWEQKWREWSKRRPIMSKVVSASFCIVWIAAVYLIFTSPKPDPVSLILFALGFGGFLWTAANRG